MSNLTPDPGQSRNDGRDLELLNRLDALHVAVISDSLDHIGIRSNVMDPHIRPLVPESRFSGFAATVKLGTVESAPEDSADWYRKEIEAIEEMQPGDVLVGSTCHRSYWGELLATTSIFHGVRGMVGDAYTRDSAALRELGFPVFVAGIHAQDSLGRVEVEDAGVPIECGGVNVKQGDLIVGDPDGVVVIPSEVAEEVITWAEDKIAKENEMRIELKDGASLSETFSKYKVL